MLDAFHSAAQLGIGDCLGFCMLVMDMDGLVNNLVGSSSMPLLSPDGS